MALVSDSTINLHSSPGSNFNLVDLVIDSRYLLSAGFWEEGAAFVAGELEGILPELPEGAILFRTSGTTGQGRWLVLERRALLLSAGAVNDWLRVDKKSVWGLCLPLNHVGGFGVVARVHVAGCGFAELSGKWDAVRFLEWLEREGVTHVSLVPTQLHDLVNAGFQAPHGLRAVVVGGGRLRAELGQAARDAGWPVLASYGMTEAGSQIATQELELLGLPYVDSPLKLLPIWEARMDGEGLLEIRGEALFSGCLSRCGGDWIFEQRDSDWFKTNDRVRLDRGCIVPEGRADSLVKIMGELVDIEAVERRFAEMSRGRIDAQNFAVVALPDARREHILVAVFEGEIPQADEIFQDYQAVASGVERFEKFVHLDSFPRTSLGKLKRAELFNSVARK